MGTLRDDGLYTAPASGAGQVVTITAASPSDPSNSFSAQVYLQDRYVQDLVFTGVSPAVANLTPAQTQYFTAAGNTAVTWSISPQGIGFLTADGIYTAPSVIDAPQSLTLTAASRVGPVQSFTAQINLVPLVTVTVTPATAQLLPSQTRQFTATVLGSSNTAVTWSLSPSGVGQISPGGLYQAPLLIASPQTVTVIATSVADGTKSASAQVQLVPAVAVTMSPAAVALAPARQQQFTALVYNTTNTAVTWRLNPAGVGSITPNGLYTAPASVPAQPTVTVTAVSQADPTKSASATVTLVTAPVTVSIAPPMAALSAGQTRQFTATVAVTWSRNPAVGEISQDGLYSAPSSVPAQQAVTVYAVSQTDPAKSASALVTLLPAQNGALQVAPNFGRQGQFLHVSITGQNTHFVQGVTKARFGPGIQVGGGVGGDFGPVKVTSPTTVVAQVSITRNAMPAPRSVAVQTGAETVTLDGGFGIAGTPVANSFSPNTAQPGQALTVTVNGVYTNFVPGITQMSFGPGVTASAVTVTSPTQLTAQIAVDAAAPLGPRTPVAQTGGEQAKLEGGFSVLGTVTGAPPANSISTPTEGATVTERTAIAGTITSPNLAYWTLESKLEDATEWKQFASGATPTVSGTFDPTMMLNGVAQIRLTAVDASGQANATTTSLVVTGNQKLGMSVVPSMDLNVPTPGFPLQVIRTYDSRDTRTGDFGAGWTLGLKNSRLTVNAAIGEGWEGVIHDLQYCIEPTRPHRVAATLPNGEQFQFEVTLTNNCRSLGPPSPTVNFTPVGATPPNAWIQMAGISQGTLDAHYPGTVTLLDPDATGALAPDQFVLIPPGGQQFQMSRQNGLQSITDLNGNKVTYTPDEIRHSNGQTVAFARDDQGRISSVTDPAGKQIAYTYNPAGDLTGVQNQANETVSYSYDSAHELLAMTDPRGVAQLQTEYAPDGRLASYTDAFGNVIHYAHDLSLRQQMKTDRLGRVTVNEYDAAGNIVRTTDAAGGVTTRTFDARGNVLSVTDPLGRTVSYTYDANDNRLSETDPLGHATMSTYDNYGRVLTVTDPLGRVTSTTTYNSQGNPTSTRDAAGNTTTVTYDANGKPLSITDLLGGVTSYAYDTNGMVIEQTDALGHNTHFTYNSNGHVLTRTTTRTTSSGVEEVTVRYEYDDLGRNTKSTYPDGSTEQTTYSSGRVTARTDRLGRQTTYDYDDAGRLTKTTHPDGTTDQSSYDAEGNRIASVDRSGRVTTYTYDGVNRLLRVVHPDGAVETTTYDLAGQKISGTDARGGRTQYAYDGAGRQTQVTDPLGQTTVYAYDAAGNVASMTDARGNLTQGQYDVLNRLVKTVYANGMTEERAYDPTGLLASATDRARQVTRYTYDALGRLTQVTDALDQSTRFAYDEVGNRISQTDANSHTTNFEYDKMGRRTRRTLPLGMSETTSHDAGGNLIGRTDFRGKSTSFAYDAMGRLLTKTPDPSLGEPAVSFTYTPTGQRASMADATGATTYTYDNRDRLLTKVAPQGALTYSWDGAGNLLSIRSSNANGTAVSYSYDALNRLSLVTDERLPSGATTYSYDPAGNLAGVVAPNGVQSLWTYDSLNQLTSVQTSKGATLASYVYTLGSAGNRSSLLEASGRQVSYTYDGLYRLTSETITSDPAGANGAVTYSFDSVGNRLTRSSTLAAIPSTASTYDANDRLNGYTYDDNGSPTAAGASAYQYDSERRLAGATPAGVSIAYDGEGNRVAVTVTGVTTTFLVDSANPTGYPQVMEELVGGVVQRVYTYGTHRISQRQLANGNWTTSFYGYDGQGSVRFLTDSSGAITDRYTYDAFGNELAVSGTTPNVNRYTGEPFDSALQMLYLRARYESPALGRFWTMDSHEGSPFDPSTLHKYLYVAGNPVDRVDPSGMFFLPPPSVLTLDLTRPLRLAAQRGRKVHRIIGDDFVRKGLARFSDQPLITIFRWLKQEHGLAGFVGGLLRPDLVDSLAQEVYEIKPASVMALGWFKLSTYLTVMNEEDPEGRVWTWGRSYSYCGPVGNIIELDDGASAIVAPPVFGVIAYTVIDMDFAMSALAVGGVLAVTALVATNPEVAVGAAILMGPKLVTAMQEAQGLLWGLRPAPGF